MSEDTHENFEIKNIVTPFMLLTIGVGLFCVFSRRYLRIAHLIPSYRSYVPSLEKKTLIVANNPTECEDAVFALRKKCSQYRVLGFDCEWVTSETGRHPVALLQLATKDGLCALIRLCKFPHSIPVNLQILLEDSSIQKVGVAPSDDATYLQKDYGLTVNSCLDLRHLIVQNGGVAKGGLAGLADGVLGVKLDKNWRVRCSDWEAEELSETQLDYAANDALVAVKIFDVLVKGYLKPPGFFTWLSSFFINHDPDWKKCDPFVDVKFKGGRMRNSQNTATTRGKPKLPFKTANRAFSTRQSPLYQNCFMQAPDGGVLCTCDRKKAIWYVSKGLAELVSEDPVTVRLKFEPSGRAVGTVGQYYTQEKSNCCVVCGKVNTCLRKNVVPHEYRKHFPRLLKDHVSHDVLLMCLNCHQRSNFHDTSLRGMLAKLCDAPFPSQDNNKLFEDRSVKSVKMAAKALFMHHEQIPLDRRKQLEDVILNYFQVSEMSDDILINAFKLNPRVVNDNYEPHGAKVVQYFSNESNGGILKLEQLWREHFLQHMKPKYLPNLWSVTHTLDRLAIRVNENRIGEHELQVAGLKNYTNIAELSRTERPENIDQEI